MQLYLQGEVCSEVGLLRRHAGQVEAAQLAGLCHDVFRVDRGHVGCLQALLQQLFLYWPAKFDSCVTMRMHLNEHAEAAASR